MTLKSGVESDRHFMLHDLLHASTPPHRSHHVDRQRLFRSVVFADEHLNARRHKELTARDMMSIITALASLRRRGHGQANQQQSQ